MATLRDDMGFLSWEAITEAERLKANRTFFFYVVLFAGNDGDGRRMHGCKRVRTEGRRFNVRERRVPAKESPKGGFCWIRRKSRVPLMDSWNPIHEHKSLQAPGPRNPFSCLILFPRLPFHLIKFNSIFGTVPVRIGSGLSGEWHSSLTHTRTCVSICASTETQGRVCSCFCQDSNMTHVVVHPMVAICQLMTVCHVLALFRKIQVISWDSCQGSPTKLFSFYSSLS